MWAHKQWLMWICGSALAWWLIVRPANIYSEAHPHSAKALWIVVILFIAAILIVGSTCLWLAVKYLLPFVRKLKGGGTTGQTETARPIAAASKSGKGKEPQKPTFWLLVWHWIIPALAFFVAFFLMPRFWPAAPRNVLAETFIVFWLFLRVRGLRKLILFVAAFAAYEIYVAGGIGAAVHGPYPNYNPDPEVICSSFYDQVESRANNHFNDADLLYFDVVMDGTNHCFGAEGEVIVPATWAYWGVTWVNYREGDYVAFLPRGASRPIGVFGKNLPSPSDPRLNYREGVRWMKLQGKGVLRFYLIRRVR